MKSSQPTFTEWRAELRGRGFKSADSGGRQGIYMNRSAGPFVQSVGALIAENRSRAFNIQLHLSMPLRCAEPTYDVILLAGDASADNVRIEQSWEHDPSFATWWPPGGAAAGLSAVIQHGLDWLDHYSEPELITDLLEQEFRSFDDEARHHQNNSLMGSLRRLIGVSIQPPSRAHFQHLLYLAMIYEERGLIDLALDRLEAYTTATTAYRSRDEQARLDRHRQTLENRPT